MVNAIAKEIAARKSYLTDSISTIYFGGGTPSLLILDEIKYLLEAIRSHYEVGNHAEITLEANPEDLSASKAKGLFDLGVNRLSIGVQTFAESKLEWMNRAHNSEESIRAFENARAAGFTNISLDLIYAIPDHNKKQWEADLETITNLQPEHISLYGLTIEEQTVFGKWERQNKLLQVPEDEAANQYLFAIEYLRDRGFRQYEVSNFGKEGFSSRHNNAYWSGVSYLGAGPGAHSFNGKSRRFNVRNNAKYLKAIRDESLYYETEVLSKTQRINEKILTQLRTANGLNLNEVKHTIGENLETLHFEFIQDILNQELIEIKEGFLSLKPKGFLVADEIALRLFFSE